GLGGFASGSVSGVRTRRYHALLLVCLPESEARWVLVNGLDVWVETSTGRFALSTQHYDPGIDSPDGYRWIIDFTAEPWPRWLFHLPDGNRIEQELFICHGSRTVALRWRCINRDGPIRLTVRPFLSGRDYHALHHENANFRFEPEAQGQNLI